MKDKEKYLNLMQRYIDAETSPEEEKALIRYVASTDNPEFDSLRGALGFLSVGKRRKARRSKMIKRYFLAGVAAAIVAVVLLTGKPDDPAITPLEIVESLRVSSLNLGDVESITTVPSGAIILVTVQLKDGSELPFIMSKDRGTGTLLLTSTN